MKEVRGYQTSSGLFFEEKEQAEFSEATHNLEKAISSSLFSAGVRIDEFLQIILTCPDEVIQYAKAYINVKNLQSHKIETEIT